MNFWSVNRITWHMHDPQIKPYHIAISPWKNQGLHFEGSLIGVSFTKFYSTSRMNARLKCISTCTPVLWLYLFYLQVYVPAIWEHSVHFNPAIHKMISDITSIWTLTRDGGISKVEFRSIFTRKGGERKKLKWKTQSFQFQSQTLICSKCGIFLQIFEWLTWERNRPIRLVWQLGLIVNVLTCT